MGKIEATKKEQYLQAREEGLSNKEIAEKFKIKVSTVKKAIGSDGEEEIEIQQPKKIGVEPNENRKPPEQVILPRTKNCIDCGQPFTMAPAEQRFYLNRGWKLPKRCEVCRKNRDEKIEKVCVDCGSIFYITKTNREFYKSKGLYEPKRCPECLKYKRERNKQLAEEAENE